MRVTGSLDTDGSPHLFHSGDPWRSMRIFQRGLYGLQPQIKNRGLWNAIRGVKKTHRHCSSEWRGNRPAPFGRRFQHPTPYWMNRGTNPPSQWKFINSSPHPQSQFHEQWQRRTIPKNLFRLPKASVCSLSIYQAADKVKIAPFLKNRKLCSHGTLDLSVVRHRLA